MSKGGGKSTSTTTPSAPVIPPELAPWVNQAVQNVMQTMGYAPLQQFAQPNPQQIPDLNAQQYSLINETMSAPYRESFYSTGDEAMNLTRAALGLAPRQGFRPSGTAPAPFSALPAQSSVFPVLPTWGPPQPAMGWVMGPDGQPVWGVVNPTPGYIPPTPAAPAGPTMGPANGLPPGTYIDPLTGTIQSEGPPPPLPGGGTAP